MPIEIKELHIHVAVETAPAPATTPQRLAGANAGAVTDMSENHKEALIAECVEQVLQILQSKMER